MINQPPPIRGIIADKDQNTTAPWLQWFRGIAADIKELSTQIGIGQPKIQFKDEGTDIGTDGGVTSVNFVGDGVVATESAGEVTVTINQNTATGFVKLDQSTPQTITGGSPRFDHTIKDLSSIDSLNFNDRKTYDAAAVLAEDWNNRALYDSAGILSANWDYKTSYHLSGNVSHDWDLGVLYSDNIAGAYSVDYEDRKLYKADGTTVAYDWENDIVVKRIVTSISSNTTAASATGVHYVYLVSGNTTLTLPTAVGNTSFYTVKKVDSAGTTTTINTTSSQTIDGSTSINIVVQYEAPSMVSDNANWSVF